MSDPETLSLYAAKAREYAALTFKQDPLLGAFIARLPQGAQVLDLGCGPGRDAGTMAKAGLNVTAIDAVPEMIARAKQHKGVTAYVATFDDIHGTSLYDGIWANFSLLHATQSDLPRHLAALHTALKPGGIFHIALKTGDGTRRDTLGRRYSYYSRAALFDLLATAGFTVIDHTTGRDLGLDHVPADWIAVTANA